MASESLQRHTLTLASSATASGEASEWARELAAKAGLTEERIYAIDLCVVELVSNVVDHAYGGKGGAIQVDLDIAGPDAILTIIDDGPAFDPLSVPAPVMATSLEDAHVGGLGIQMVRSMASRCRYERRQGKNILMACFGGS